MKRWWLDQKGEKPDGHIRQTSARKKAKRRFSEMDANNAKEFSKKTQKRLFKAFVLAAVCHLLILSGVSQLPSQNKSASADSSEPVSVVFLKSKNKSQAVEKKKKLENKTLKEKPKDELPKGQVVALPPDHSSERPERAEYLSETHHKVKRESRSRFATNDADAAAAHRLQMGVKGEKPQHGKDDELQIGDAKLTQKKKGGDVAKQRKTSQAPQWMLAMAQRKAQQELQLKLDINGNVKNQPRQQAQRGNAAKDMARLGAQGGYQGNENNESEMQGHHGHAQQDSLASLIPSFVDLQRWTGAPKNDYLPEVETEDETRLNTWQFQHAPFFNRIANGVRRTWNPGMAIRQNDPQFEVYGSQSRHTVVSVTIDREGHLSYIDIYATSGAGFLDQEAVKAFQKAAPFPNPPKGLFGREQTFTFNFGFNVDYQKRWNLDIDWQPYQ